MFGRMLSMVYPDGEVLTYGYDRGGLLASARGDRPATAHAPAEYEEYLRALRYDHFGQRVYQRVGNGVVTKYGYEPDTRRLATLYTRKPGERLLQNLFYRYDLVGNVLGVTNALGEAQPSHAGEVKFTYRYDDLHRLTYAHGEAKSRPGTLDTFTSGFKYSDIHNMTSNVQEHHVLHGPTGGGEYPPHTNHALEYAYGGKGPHQATRIGDASFVYDDNGNTLRECRDPADASCTARPAHLRRYVWTEENRLDTVIDGGGKNATKFFYDADGQRVAKLGRGGESITIGQFWALKGRRAATKHVFAGTARIASKLLPPPGWDDVPRGPVDSTGTVMTTVGEVDNGCNPSNYQPQKCGVLPGGEPVLNDYYADAKVRPETYYYHPDHLGSTSWVTDQSGRVHEHVEYFPYGAVWRDPRSDVGASPVKGQRFLFTGKELDEETGLYYFGARYYDPVRVRWVSPDPIVAAYLGDSSKDRTEGAFKLSVFAYARWSPVLFTDPDGRDYEILIGGPYGDHPYGHAALRVFGKGYDVTYDFGRYGRTWGAFGSKGEGVLRVWNDFKAYIRGENATGRTTTGYVFRTSPEQDKATIGYFDELQGKGNPRSRRQDMTSFVLKREYDAATHNCTTVTIDGVQQGLPQLARALSDAAESKGRGLSWLERRAAPVGERIFMPADAEANLKKQKSAATHVYKAEPEVTK